jgi:hypothetical protein
VPVKPLEVEGMVARAVDAYSIIVMEVSGIVSEEGGG